MVGWDIVGLVVYQVVSGSDNIMCLGLQKIIKKNHCICSGNLSWKYKQYQPGKFQVHTSLDWFNSGLGQSSHAILCTVQILLEVI